MPTIQSKKYPTDDHIQFVSADAWEDMKKKGLDRRYKVLDDDDLRATIIPAPESILELGKIEVEEIPNRADIKAQLDEKGIEYNTRASTDKLIELLKESNDD